MSQSVDDGGHSQREIRSGVVIRYREDVDPIEVIPMCDDPMRAGDDGLLQELAREDSNRTIERL